MDTSSTLNFNQKSFFSHYFNTIQFCYLINIIIISLFKTWILFNEMINNDNSPMLGANAFDTFICTKSFYIPIDMSIIYALLFANFID
jgi:hypothetical protein